MPFRSLILDSGAFTVWTQGASIDLDEYLAFCVRYPGVSYYVNLDVIPGVANDKRSLTPAAIDRACRQSWDNYLKMIQVLPKDKVIPVYHQNDPVKWLHKYLEFGVKYIGISPANDEQTMGRIQWLKPLLNVLFDGAGRPVVKTHGFAVTSFDLIKFMEWHSVDSASWKVAPGWGTVYMPQVVNGQFVYDRSPTQISVTPQVPRKKHQGHLNRLSPLVRERLVNFVTSCGLELGTSDLVQVDAAYSLDRSAGEIWLDKKKRILMRPIVQGVTNSYESRAILCAKFMLRVNKALRHTVKHIYLAGLPMPYMLEFQLPCRLLSWYYSGRQPSGIAYIQGHIDRLPGGPKYKGAKK